MKNIRTLFIAVIALTAVIQLNAQTTKQALPASASLTGDVNCPVPAQNITDSIASTINQPIAVTDFSGVRSDNNVILTWSAEAGFDAAKFIVEKSNDGSNWQALATVDASANNNTPCVYYYGDTKPFASSYYRLKPVDNDGAGEYSTVLQVGASVKIKKNKK